MVEIIVQRIDFHVIILHFIKTLWQLGRKRNWPLLVCCISSLNNQITYELFHLNHNFWFYRFSLEDTKYLLVLCFSIPASLWIFSCSCLFGCSKTLRVEESGQMRIRCRRQVDDLESPYRRASDSSKDFSGNNIGQKFKYKKNGEKISWKSSFKFLWIVK